MWRYKTDIRLVIAVNERSSIIFLYNYSRNLFIGMHGISIQYYVTFFSYRSVTNCRAVYPGWYGMSAICSSVTTISILSIVFLFFLMTKLAIFLSLLHCSLQSIARISLITEAKLWITGEIRYSKTWILLTPNSKSGTYREDLSKINDAVLIAKTIIPFWNIFFFWDGEKLLTASKVFLSPDQHET